MKRRELLKRAAGAYGGVLAAWRLPAAMAEGKQTMASAETEAGLAWHDVREGGVEGKGWTETESFFDRQPAKAKGVVRPPVWDLSRHSAGMCFDFETDATTIHARWTLISESLAMPHMPATGVSGLDLYARDEGGRWGWVSIGRPEGVQTQTVLAGGLRPGRRTYRVYLPLYNGVTSVAVGVAPDAFFRAIPPRREGAIVFYGTSIVQGGCASRPGMAHPAILGRRLERPTINLGFSGNGQMEPEVAALLAEIAAGCFVIDCLPNMGAEMVAERTEPLVRTIRRAHPETPVVLVEDRTFCGTPFVAGHREGHAARRGALRKAYEALVADGVPGLHYVSGEHLLGDDDEATVDGSHPTDLGFVRMADALEPVLRPLV